VELARIAELLHPFLAAAIPFSEAPLNLTDRHLSNISTYIDLLLRWNSRIKLTSVRDPESIVTRHFGESLFAARAILATTSPRPDHLADVGSGAGFPGLPIKIFLPHLQVTLIESHHKKVTFLREVIRALGLVGIDVAPRRAEDFPSASFDIVTLRAVERFQAVLPVATRLVRHGGHVVLLVGRDQQAEASKAPGLTWQSPLAVPGSTQRIILIGSSNAEPKQ